LVFIAQMNVHYRQFDKANYYDLSNRVVGARPLGEGIRPIF